MSFTWLISGFNVAADHIEYYCAALNARIFVTILFILSLTNDPQMIPYRVDSKLENQDWEG